jgi:phenylacetate-CoA oxygenase PaaH subunit
MGYQGPAAAIEGSGEPFEVFRQERPGGPMVHVGNLCAPDPRLALHYAREIYARRGEALVLWVVRRADIREIDDPDLLHPPLERRYRTPAGYPMRDKLARHRRRTSPAEAAPNAPANPLPPAE